MVMATAMAAAAWAAEWISNNPSQAIEKGGVFAALFFTVSLKIPLLIWKYKIIVTKKVGTNDYQYK